MQSHQTKICQVKCTCTMWPNAQWIPQIVINSAERKHDCVDYTVILMKLRSCPLTCSRQIAYLTFYHIKYVLSEESFSRSKSNPQTEFYARWNKQSNRWAELCRHLWLWSNISDMQLLAPKTCWVFLFYTFSSFFTFLLFSDDQGGMPQWPTSSLVLFEVSSF